MPLQAGTLLPLQHPNPSLYCVQVLGLGSLEACMAAVELPPLQEAGAGVNSDTDSASPAASAQAQPGPSAATAAALHALLRERYRIEVPVLCLRRRHWVRISAQIYNELDEYRRLAAAVVEVRQLGLLLAPHPGR